MTLSGLLMAPVEVSSFPAPRPRRCGVFARRANADDARVNLRARDDAATRSRVESTRNRRVSVAARASTGVRVGTPRSPGTHPTPLDEGKLRPGERFRRTSVVEIFQKPRNVLAIGDAATLDASDGRSTRRVRLYVSRARYGMLIPTRVYSAPG